MMNLSKIFKLKPDLSGSQRGMTLFIAVVVMGILLFISFAVVNITLKASLFASSGRDSQYAFYAADSGIECAVYWDSRFDVSKFDISYAGAPINCKGDDTISNGLSIPGTTTTSRIGLGAGTLTNFALSSNGGIASASSVHENGNFPASSVINGERNGANWGVPGGGWNDNTNNSYPDSLQVAFSGPKNIGRIDVYTLPVGFPNVTVGADTPSTQWGIVDFKVQYDNGSGWVTVPGGDVKGNTLAWRTFQFPTILNVSKIRVEVTKSNDNGEGWFYSRIVELEAWGVAPGTSLPSIFHFNMTGSDSGPCAIVTVDKSGGGTYIKSRGYNTCDTSNPRRMERGIEVTY